MNRKPKLLLVFTNISSLLPKLLFPYDIAALVAYLKQYGYEPQIYIADTPAHIKNFRRALDQIKPDIIGFTAVYVEYQHVLTLMQMAKAWRRDVPIIVGGKHATLAPETVIVNPNVDAIVLGEGEGALLDLMQDLEAGFKRRDILNVWYKDENGGIIENDCRDFIEDMDSLPYPDYSIVNFQQYLDSNLGTNYAVIGRGGCSAKCTFCGVPPQAKRGHGKFLRRPTVDFYLDHLAYVSKNYRFNHIYYRDDHFTEMREWFLEFAEKFPKRFNYTYEVLTRADSLDDDVVQGLKDSHCDCVWIGVDSGHYYINKKILEKNVENDLLVRKCRQLQGLGIKTLLTNMVGFPEETPEHFKATIEINKVIYKNNPTISRAFGPTPTIFIFCPFPGTKLWDKSKKDGILKVNEVPKGHVAYSDSYLEMPQFKRWNIKMYKLIFRFLVFKDSNPGWAVYFLMKEIITELANNVRLAESYIRTLEYYARYGEWLQPNPFIMLFKDAGMRVEEGLRMLENGLAALKSSAAFSALRKLMETQYNGVLRPLLKRFNSDDRPVRIKVKVPGIIEADGQSEQIPGVGVAVEVPSADMSVMLAEDAHFYRRIGSSKVIEAPAGKVFCVVQLDWLPSSSSASEKPILLQKIQGGKHTQPEVLLHDLLNNFYPENDEARRAFVEMQNNGRNTDNKNVGSASATRDVKVFEVDPNELRGDLYLLMMAS